MKKMIFALALLSSTAAFAGTFTCNAPKNNPNAFLTGTYASMMVNSKSLRFQQYDKKSNDLMRDYKYNFVKVAGGQSQVTGKLKFELKEEIKSYGDSIYTLYVDQSLLDGRPGAMMFAGQGYSWDWNFCKPTSNP